MNAVAKEDSAAANSLMYRGVKVAMLMETPFFASLLLDMMSVKLGKFPELFGAKNPTAATDGKTIWIDEDFFASLKVEERVFLVCHEIGHAMWSHFPRGNVYHELGFEGRKFSRKLWNVAGDYVINAMLVESKTGKMPKTGLLDLSRFTGLMGVSDVYKELEKKLPPPPPPKKCSGSGGGDGESEGGEGEGGEGEGEGKSEGGEGGVTGSVTSDSEDSATTLDVHVTSTAGVEAASHEWRRAIESAYVAAKSVGKLPSNLARLVEELLEPQVSWQSLLQLETTRTMQRTASTWSRPHRRRLVTQGVYLPAYTGHGAGEVVVVVDTSGSIGSKELQIFLSEVEGILSTCHPECVYLLGCDAAINTVHRLEYGDSLVDGIPPLGGGGGTSFIPPFDWVEDEGIRPSVLIYLTDMMGAFPAGARFPVIWCSSTLGLEGPFGRTVYVDFKERQ